MKKFGIFLMLVFVLSAVGVDAQKRKARRAKVKRSAPVATWNGGNQQPEPAVNSFNLAFAIKANSWVTHPVYVTGTTQLEGRFNAQGGSRNDIEVYILDDDGMTNFKNGNSASTFYNSNGSKTVGDFNVVLSGEKMYYIVFKNSAWFDGKAVTLALTQTVF